MAKRLYCSGPMRGYDQYNFPAFDEMCEKVRNQGDIPIGPQELDRLFGWDENEEREVTRQEMINFLLRDLVIILTECDGIVVLNGWKNSTGAKAEVALAQAIGLPIYNEQLDEIEVALRAESWLEVADDE